MVETNLGRAIKVERERLGWSQYRLAEESGVSRPTIANIERGDTEGPQVDTLKKLALAMGIDVDKLLRVPKETAALGELVDQFLASDWGRDAQPTDEEVRRLREMPVSWFVSKPAPKALYYIIQAWRASGGA
jgi:transcriptional regulator with XRE-family HTH domain